MQHSEHFVTLFDSAFMAQGLAMYHSLRRQLSNAVLWVVAMDDWTAERLTEIGFRDLRVISIKDLETPELLALKEQRSVAEYCWTVTPHAPRAVFDSDPKVERVTYVDADLYFLGDPSPLLAELDQSGGSVLITEHAFDAEYDTSEVHGRFCVQFMTFNRGDSEPVRAWWEERCEEWCFAFYEEGKFGDQKYLDDWTERFPEQVHILRARGAIVAPWNARRFPYSEAVAWHFHGLRLLGPRRVLLFTGYSLPRTVVKDIYKPYLYELRHYAIANDLDATQLRMTYLGFWIRKSMNVITDILMWWRSLWFRKGRVERW